MPQLTNAKKDRYPGIRSFEAEDKRLFYGRTNEIDDLFSLVKIKPLVVLFGKSGLGKSSLLKAGLGSVLLENHFFPLMIRVQDTSVSPIATVLSELEPFIDQKKLAQFGGKSSNQIWECINACNFTDAAGNPATPVLIFDQFEELFNHEKSVQNNWAAQLSDLIEERRPKDVVEALQQIPRRERTAEQLEWFEPPAVKILFAIRSDRMSQLHQLRYQLPAILQNRFELLPLQSSQANEAIEKPAALIGTEFTTLPFTYAPETVQEIQSNLSNEAGEIESFQLQIVCQHIEEKVKAQQSYGTQNIIATSDFLGGEGGIQHILKNYYDNHVKYLGSEADQLAARKLLEEGLIADGRRVGVADAVVKGTFGIHDDLLVKLLESRLIRPENTRLGRSFEISHDTLVAPILSAYENRRLQEERIAKQKELEEQERLLAIERRKRRISTMITVGAVVLSLFAISASIFAINKQQEAVEAKLEAVAQKEIAIQEKQNAEAAKIKAFESEQKAKDREKDAIKSDSLAQIEKLNAINSDRVSKHNLEIAEKAKSEADKQKRIAITQRDLANQIIDAFYFFGDSLALASKKIGLGIQYGYINKEGNPIIDYQYDEALPFDDRNGFAIVKKNRKDYLLTPDKNEHLLARNIKDLTPEIFALDLRGQDLTHIPDTVFQFSQLKIILLNNQLSSLPAEIGKLKNLERLYLSNNQLTSLPAEIGELENLEWLDLEDNRLTSLPAEIGKLVNLQSLYLDNNELRSLPAEIGRLEKIKVLELRVNKLTSLPSEIRGLENLQMLYLTYNHLDSLPAEFGKLVNLQSLELHNNRLTNLPSEFGELENLEWLDFSSNRLKSLPEGIWKLENLEELELRGNKLTSLPAEFGKLVHLESLDLRGNQLESLPPEFSELVNLQSLDLYDNQLTSLPAEFGKLVNLQDLFLGSNQLASLPAEIGKLVTLQSLYLDNNELTSLPAEFGKLVNLEYLNLRFNQLTSLPAEIRKLENLERLYLSRNQLESLPAKFGELENLQVLYLNYNKLRSLPAEFGKLVNLQDLELRRNQLTSLPSEFGKLVNLKKLYLSNNQLTSLPAEFGKLVNLRELNLIGNQLTSLPAEFGKLVNLQDLYLRENAISKGERRKIKKLLPNCNIDFY